MLNIQKIKKIFWSFLLVFMTVPNIVFGQVLTNPLGEGTTIEILIGRVIKAALGLSGVAALAMFVYGGILWMTSKGETSDVKKGTDTIKWAVFGLVIILTAYILVNAVIDAITKGTVLELPETPGQQPAIPVAP